MKLSMNRKATEVNRRNFKKMMLHSLPHHWHYNCLIVAQVKIVSLDCYETEKEYLNFFTLIHFGVQWVCLIYNTGFQLFMDSEFGYG